MFENQGLTVYSWNNSFHFQRITSITQKRLLSTPQVLHAMGKLLRSLYKVFYTS